MPHIDTPQMRGRIGFARADITPPVGIYHRLWGAATHERSTGVHRPLLATAMFLGPVVGDAQLILELDQCLLDANDIATIRGRIQKAVPTSLADVQVTVSHTHASGWMSRSREPFPGGELIPEYLKRLTNACVDLAVKAAENARPASLVFGNGRCSLAAQRDFFDAETNQFVCGFTPDGPTDDTVLVGKAIADDGTVLGTIVNYACHPTTLAWENTLISPDFIGAMREVVETHSSRHTPCAEGFAPCLFLQGASGDLGPREGFVGNVEVADRNGRQLGFAALSALESLSPPRTRFAYAGPVVSGATLGTWKHESTYVDASWSWRTVTVDLPYRADLPTIEGTKSELAKWQENEKAAQMRNALDLARDCHARVERMTRQLARLSALPAGPSFPVSVTLGRAGTTLWVFVPGELYHVFQTTLRSRFTERTIVVVTLTNDWQPGYLPTESSYGKGIYQETIAVLAAGSLERLIDSLVNEVTSMS
ncbi:MAG: hypothetical protein EXS09_17125 [Gemmataceae bacterium]|nr:hypothetical protein [Gemmataceae bacterium]